MINLKKVGMVHGEGSFACEWVTLTYSAVSCGRVFDIFKLRERLGPARHLGGYSGALLQNGNKQNQHAVPLLGYMHCSILWLVSNVKALSQGIHLISRMPAYRSTLCRRLAGHQSLVDDGDRPTQSR